jgi:hypothetical protein
MTDDLTAEMATLSAKGVQCSVEEEARWRSVTRIHLPGGGVLYQSKLPSAFDHA